MASCDVHLEEGAAKVDSKIEIRTTKCGIVLQPTKIPGPVSLDNSGNFIFTSTREYTSLMKSLQPKSDHDNSFSSTSTLVNTTEDSGVRMHCSTVDDDNCSCNLPIQPSSSTPRLQRCIDTIETNNCAQDFEVNDQLTLKVLQRAVADMEADVALHAEILDSQMKLARDKQSELQLEEQVEAKVERNLLLDAAEQHQLLKESVQQSPQDSLQEMIQELQLEPQTSQQSDSKEVYEQIHLAQSVTQVSARERKHVRVEDLLQAENDVELLHKLLQTDGELGTGESSDLAQDNNPVLATDSNDDKNVEDDDAESPPKRVNLVHSLLQIICGKGMRNLSYPILFCGMAVGLIYYFCKN